MYLDVWNVLLVSLLVKVKNLALFALLEPTKTKLDKELAKLVLQALGQWKKDPNLKLTVFPFVVMVLTVLLAWYLAWNVPRTVTLVNPHLTDTKNALLALTTSSLTNLEPTESTCAEKSVNQDSTLKLVWLLAHLVP